MGGSSGPEDGDKEAVGHRSQILHARPKRCLLPRRQCGSTNAAIRCRARAHRARESCGSRVACRRDPPRRVRRPIGRGPFYKKCGFTELGRAVYRGVPLVYFEFVVPTIILNRRHRPWVSRIEGRRAADRFARRGELIDGGPVSLDVRPKSAKEHRSNW
jgi:hypothetical protein